MKPRIILSGVNVSELGILAIFKDALASLATEYADHYNIIALVHRRNLYNIPNVTYLEFPEVKPSWLRRIYFEYFVSKKISLRFNPKVWIAIHDMTPNVSAPIRAVYCHNATPFHSLRISEALADWKFGLFVAFYRFLYRINIHTNTFVIVQQQWIREEFRKSFGVRNVVVAHPVVKSKQTPKVGDPFESNRHPYRFFYPSFPRPFKNAEVCLEATRILENRGVRNFELWLTIDETINRYAARMMDSFSDLKSVRWLGILPRNRIFELYNQADCLLFSSRLETWGMPISEFRPFDKPILAADLPYAHETAGGHHQVKFFDPNDASKLADLMEQAATGRPIFARAPEPKIAEPLAHNWSELWSLLLDEARPVSNV